MFDTITADKYSKPFTHEGSSVIGYNDLGKPMSGKDWIKFFYSKLGTSTAHHVGALYSIMNN